MGVQQCLKGQLDPAPPTREKSRTPPAPAPAGRPGVRGLIFKYLAYLKGKSTGIISMWLHLEIDTDKQIQIYSGFFFFFFNTFEAQAEEEGG